MYFLWKHFYKLPTISDRQLLNKRNVFIIAGSLWIAFIGIFIPVILFQYNLRLFRSILYFVSGNIWIFNLFFYGGNN